MGVKKYCLDVEKIRRKMYDVNRENVLKSDISEKLEITSNTMRSWEKEFPHVIKALYNISELTGCRIDEFIKEV